MFMLFGNSFKFFELEYQLSTFNNLTMSPRAALVHLYLRAGSTFPVPVCTVPHGHWVNKADTEYKPVQQG